MKNKFFLFLCVASLFVSCAQSYHFVQVFETKASSMDNSIQVEKSGMVYEDSNCILFYSLWAERGDASFAIYNKTNNIMYIDLSKSFFIRNGIANDYYKDREWSETNTNTSGTQTTTSAAVSGNLSYSYGASATYLGNFGHLPLTSFSPILTSANVQKTESYGLLYSTALANSFATSKSASIAIKEQKILAIPPQTAKIITEYSISNELFLDCDLDRYPSEKDAISFDETNSPLRFANYVTYKLGESGQDIVIKNEFYVSKITNYAQPYIYEFVERAKRPCQNMTNDDSKNYKDEYPVKVYDKIYTFNTGHCFYLEYSKYSNRKLYKGDTKTYYYDSEYQGYTLEGSSNGDSSDSDYKRRLLHPIGK